MVTQLFDTVIIGDHLGGLAAAALRVKRGKRVLLFSDSDRAFEDRPLEYINAICGGPEREAGLGRFFHEIGMSPFGPLGDDRIHFGPLHPPLQVVLPKHRVNIYKDLVARNWEMEREFGDVEGLLTGIKEKEKLFRDRLFRFWNQSSEEEEEPALRRPMAGLARYFRFRGLEKEAEKESFSSFLGTGSFPQAFVDVLAGEVYGVDRVLPTSLPWFAGLRSIQVLQAGLFQNASGQSGILWGLKEAFLRFGGRCIPLGSLAGMEYPRKEGVNLHLSSGDTVQAKHAIVDLPLARGLSFFKADAVKALLKKGLNQADQEQAFGVMRLRVKKGWHPECMGKYIILDPSLTPEGSGRPVLFLARQPGDSPGGRESYAMEILGYFPPGKKEAEQKEVIWKRLKDLMPFLEQSVEGEPVFWSGSYPHYLPQSRERKNLESYYRTGRRYNFFRVRDLTFLRNEEYVGTGLTAGLLSGIWAVG